MKARKALKRTRIKAKRLTPVDKLQNKAFEICRMIVIKRDGIGCQVQKNYSQIEVKHTEIMQIDHCFSRANKNLYLDISNLTCICSGCNMLKGFDSKAIDVAVHEIVRKREGDAIYERMKETAMSRSANVNWSKRWWVESQISILEEILKNMQ